MFINPPLGQPLPAKPDATLGGDDVTLHGLHYGADVRTIYDELRVGDTYASVSPTN